MNGVEDVYGSGVGVKLKGGRGSIKQIRAVVVEVLADPQ